MGAFNAVTKSLWYWKINAFQCGYKSLSVVTVCLGKVKRKDEVNAKTLPHCKTHSLNRYEQTIHYTNVHNALQIIISVIMSYYYCFKALSLVMITYL